MFSQEREVQRREVEVLGWSRKMKISNFPYSTVSPNWSKKRWNNVIATKEKSICFIKRSFLQNKETIIYKIKKRDRRTMKYIFWPFFKDMKS